MKIAVDFDGTIVEHSFPAIGNPLPFAFDVLKALIEDGHELILWSNREGKRLDEAVEFCSKNGVEFYSVNSEYPNAAWTGSGVSRKIIADIYIDDKNLGGLPDWGDIYKMINQEVGDEKHFVNDVRSEDCHHHHHHHHHHKHVKLPPIIRMFVERVRNARNNFKLDNN